MKDIDKKYKAIPFWSWNDELEESKLLKQIDWMKENEIGGYFMHARGGLKTEYLSDEWFRLIKSCTEYGTKIGLDSYAYDENGWPSGFAGGKLLDDIKNHDMYLTYNYGEYDNKSLVSYIIENNKLIRVTEGKECLNIYSNYSGSTADILNKEVVKKFIKLTHEKYKENDPEHLIKGFFTDEPQYFKTAHPYTRVLPKYFKKKYNEDLLDRLGLMFVEAEGYRDFRYKYWLSMQDLMLNSFGKLTYEFGLKNDYVMTGHYCEEDQLFLQMECCAGIMPFYEYLTIPGVDRLARDNKSDLPFKQVVSACAQLGKPQILTETFGCCGWDVTPLELKHITDQQYVNGINLMCHHLLPYSEYGQRKRDYPSHFSDINPWIRNGFKDFNYYYNYLGEKIANSKEKIHVAVFHPIRSCYFNYKRSNTRDSVLELDDSIRSLMDTLNSNHIEYHFIDETLLEKYGKVSSKKLICGKCKYDTIIFPLIYTMGKNTERLLKKFVSNGGKIYLFSDKPEYLEGTPYSYDYLVSNTTLEDIKKKMNYKELTNNKDVKVSYRVDENNNPFLYVVNYANEETKAILKVKGYKSFKAYDILNDSYKVISNKITLSPYESMLLYPSNEMPEKVKKLSKLKLSKSYDIIGSPNNYMTIDYLKYSKDGINYSDSYYAMGIFDQLLKDRYKGDLYLKYEFESKVNNIEISALIENPNLINVKVNGNIVYSTETSLYEDHTNVYDIKEYLKKGHNEIILHMDYYQSEDVYYALFGENVNESLLNCLAYDSSIEAIYLRGNFSVYGKFIDQNGVYLGVDFYLDKPNKRIKVLVLDGYPFFSGELKLKQEVEVNDTNKYLLLPERFQLAKIYVNGNFVKQSIFDRTIDLSNYLTIGKNEIVIEYAISNRNMFGPLHNGNEEPWVGPWSFEKFGSYNNSVSPLVRRDFAFVKHKI